MRLAYLSTDPGITYGGTKGAAVHVEELAAALAGQGVEILLLVSSRAADAPAPPEEVTLEVLPGPAKRPSVDERLAADAERADWLATRIQEFGADVLYERIALHSAAGSSAARAAGVPHLVELNAPLLVEALRYRRLERAGDADMLELEVLRQADLILAVSRPLAEYARGRGARRVEVVPNAVALERFKGAVPRGDQSLTAVFSGSLRPWHGIDMMVEAWSLLGADAPTLLVVGDGAGRELLESAGAEVTGSVPHADVPGLLGRAHIGLAPYAADAPDYFSPLKLFEYLAAGLATVASDLPGVRDVVTSEAAIVVPKGDAHAFADAVAGLVDDRGRRERLGHAGRDLVAAEHTWQHRARTIIGLAAPLAHAEEIA